MLSWALLASACPGRRPDPGLCPGALCSGACAVGFVLLPRSPLRGAAPEPLRAAPGPAVRAAAFRELGALSWARRCLLVSPGARGHPRPPGSCSNSLRGPFPPGKVGAAPAPPGRGSPVLGTLAPASARLLAGPLPLGGLCFFTSFSPSSYLDRCANSSHCSIPAGLSLNLRPN